MDQFPHVKDFTFYTVIRVLDNNRTTIKTIRYDLPFELSNKYNWFFKYRAALLQIEHPRFEVRIARGKYIKQPADLEKNLKNKISNAKAKVTEMKNKLNMAFKIYQQNCGRELFKPETDFDNEPEVIKFREKLQRQEKELSELINLSVVEFYEKYKHRFPFVTLEMLENGEKQLVETIYLD